MFCSITVSLIPIVVASHAARALRLPAFLLGVLPSKSVLIRVLDVGKLEPVQHTPFSLSTQSVVTDLGLCCCAQYGGGSSA
jgi:hypothetical protein